MGCYSAQANLWVSRERVEGKGCTVWSKSHLVVAAQGQGADGAVVLTVFDLLSAHSCREIRRGS